MGEGVGAGGVDQEGPAMRAGPQVVPGSEGAVGPRRSGFQDVVGSAQRGEVGGVGGSAVGVGDDVVGIQTRPTRTVREPAVAVAEGDVVAEPVRDVVGIDAFGVG